MKKILIITRLLFIFNIQITYTQWEEIPEGPGINLQMSYLAQDPDTLSNLFMAQAWYLSFSSDYGNSWRIIDFFKEGIKKIYIFMMLMAFFLNQVITVKVGILLQ